MWLHEGRVHLALWTFALSSSGHFRTLTERLLAGQEGLRKLEYDAGPAP